MANQKCKPGYVWCPNSKKCIPEEEQKSQGQGKGMGKGQGKGPIGNPTKEDKELVAENYIDLYLEEVEIRNIYIQEVDLLKVPLPEIMNKVYRQLIRATDTRDEFINRCDKIYKEIKDLEKVVKIQPNNRVKTGALQYARKNLKWAMKRRSETRWEVLRIKKVYDELKRDPGVLTKIPYLYQIIGATLIVAGVGYMGYKIYKRFIRKAAKACQDKKGKSKNICMFKYQMDGLESSKKLLIQGRKGCSGASDTQICKAKFNKKINAIDKRINKKKTQLKKLMTVKKEDTNMLNKADQLVDEILLGDYSLFKKLEEGDTSIDSVLDEIENSIDHVPDQDLPELYQSVKDELSINSNTSVEERLSLFKEGMSKPEMKAKMKAIAAKCKKQVKDPSQMKACMAKGMKSMYQEWMVSQLPVDKITPIEEQMLESVKLLSEDAYKEFFKKMLNKYGVKTPSELSDEKKKEFFNAVDKGWKANKETD